MEKNIYAKMLEAVAEGESVALKTEIKGTEGDIADGIKRARISSALDGIEKRSTTKVCLKIAEFIICLLYT